MRKTKGRNSCGDYMSRFTRHLEERRSFRYLVIAFIAVDLAFKSEIAPMAFASTVTGTSADRAAPTAASQPSKQSATQSDDAIPELWTPRTAVVVDASPPLDAASLFDGDPTTGLT